MNDSDEDYGFTVGLSPEQALRAITEEGIGSLEEAASVIGKAHRIIITDHVLPSHTQLQYLHKSWKEIGKVIALIHDLSIKEDKEESP